MPDWLQNGEEYGEVGPALQLDRFMVRVAAFRARALAFLPSASAGLSTSTPDLDFLAHTGKQLEDDLVDWSINVKFRDIPSERPLSLKTRKHLFSARRAKQHHLMNPLHFPTCPAATSSVAPAHSQY